MEAGHLHLLSTYLKKWSYQENRLTLSYSFFTEKGYGRHMVDMRVNAPQNMVNDFLNKVVYKAKEIFTEGAETGTEPTVRLINEGEVQRKLNVFLNKILKEFNTNKRSRGKVRMISSRSMDFYYNDYEYESLDEQAKFYVHLNRGINKMNGDLWQAAIDDLTKALAFLPDQPMANKYMAEALLKSHRAEEALPYYERYAEFEQSMQGLNELAHAYIKLQRYKEATVIFKKMLVMNENDLLVKIGQAQIAYLQGKPYLPLLDAIKEVDEEWLRDYLKRSWAYKLPGYTEDETKMWNAATASRYLGYDRPFDLTKRAFNEEIPCYFDSEKGTIRFVKEEIDRWVEIVNRYHIDNIQHVLHEERLTAQELKTGKQCKPVKKRKKKEKSESENVEISEESV
jgi:tetratricopeptide (TPR) repeat protein